MIDELSARRSIIVCEPQCCGFEHSSFNAAFLASVLYAFPQDTVVFIAEPEHSALVNRVLGNKSPELVTRIEWVVIPLPPKSFKSIRRLMHELRWLSKIKYSCTERDTRAIYFCSFTEVGLLALILKATFWRKRPPVFAIAHWILGSLLFRRSKKPWKWGLNYQFLLHLPHPRSMRYLALGDSLVEHLQRLRPKFADRFAPIDMPYLWDSEVRAPLDSKPQRIHFGFLGCRQPGIIQYYSLVQAVEERTTKADFSLVGFLNDPGRYPESIRERPKISKEPLPPEEYARRARELTYTIWCGRSDDYRLIASAAFLDSLSYCKPGIYIHTPYIENYFDKMGDIGYLCENSEEMCQLILSIIEDFPLERYKQQCANILRGRHLFDPPEVAQKLRLYEDIARTVKE